MNLTVSEAAERVGVSPLTLKRLEKRGRTTPIRDLNNWRLYRPEEIQQLIALYARNATR